LEDDSYTYYYTVLGYEGRSTTPPTVLCSLPFPQNKDTTLVIVAHQFFITICAASDSGGMENYYEYY
jgi:hypothetical protein